MHKQAQERIWYHLGKKITLLLNKTAQDVIYALSEGGIPPLTWRGTLNQGGHRDGKSKPLGRLKVQYLLPQTPTTNQLRKQPVELFNSSSKATCPECLSPAPFEAHGPPVPSAWSVKQTLRNNNKHGKKKAQMTCHICYIKRLQVSRFHDLQTLPPSHRTKHGNDGFQAGHTEATPINSVHISI